MHTLLTFLGLMGLSAVLIVLGVILGDYASWYFAWIVGTAMIVLVSAAGLAWLDAQDAERRARSAVRPRSGRA
jgi:predicted outer membrane lipoprotein